MIGNGKYILQDGEPVPCEDVMEWGKWMETADRKVAITESEGVQVSTVFLGLDHNFSDYGAPILYETMVFGGPLDGEMNPYSTRAEAERGHKEMVRRL